MIKPETQRNEYKSSWQDGYFEWISGYANASGGVLYVGVNDDGYVVGLKDAHFLLETLPNQINAFLGITVSIDYGNAISKGTNLKYDIVPDEIAQKAENLYIRGILTTKAIEDIEVAPADTCYVTSDVQKLFDAAPGLVKQLRRDESYRKKLFSEIKRWQNENFVNASEDGTLEYVWITVEPFSYAVSYRSHYYKRSGGTTREITGMELSRFLMDKAGLKWDGMPVKIVDFDKDALAYLREHAVERGRLTEREVAVPNDVLIKNLNMMRDDGEYTRAAAMLFGNPERIMVGSFIMIGYFAPAGGRGANKANEVIYQNEIHGPLILQAEKAMDLLYSKYFKAMIDYNGIHREETFMIPHKAMREILLNAIAHKNYASGNPIQIKVYDDHVTVMNEGIWPFDELKVEDAYNGAHSSYKSNPLIASGFYKAGEIETWGQGFEKIKDACDAAGAPLPEIKATKGSVTLVIRGSKHYMELLRHNLGMQDTAQVSTHVTTHVTTQVGTHVVKISLDDDQMNALLDYCIEPKSREEMQKFCGIRTREYFRKEILSPLVKSGRVGLTIPEKPKSSKQKYFKK